MHAPFVISVFLRSDILLIDLRSDASLISQQVALIDPFLFDLHNFANECVIRACFYRPEILAIEVAARLQHGSSFRRDLLSPLLKVRAINTCSPLYEIISRGSP